MDARVNPAGWRDRAGTAFACEKQPVNASRGVVVTNHPLASAAGAEMLAAGGNAIDAAISALFTLTVVEPMMVGIIGGGMAHVRLADGSHRIVDGQSAVPLACKPDCYRPVPGAAADVFDTIGDESLVGLKAVATPGSLKAWCETLRRFGTLPLADVMQPAIKHASRGFLVTPYLSECIANAAPDMLKDDGCAKVFLPGGKPLPAGARLARPEYADTLALIAKDGEAALYSGMIGQRLVECMEARGGFIGKADLAAIRTIERQPIRGSYRGWEIIGPPPPAASGVHVTQMLNILEGFDVRALGFGSRETVHLLAEVIKIAFADRAAATADPDFVEVPVARLTSKAYADERRAMIDLNRAKRWSPGVSPSQSAHTTHVTVADSTGNAIATTQTINSLFGARFMVPGTGIVPNNYMNLFDPRPGHALSVQPGKRVTTSMSPMMALRDGKLVYALGLPGGKKIFPSALQALVNLIDHGMSLQEAVEAPRIWTEGNALEIEPAFSDALREELVAMGHQAITVPTVAGGMNAVQFNGDGTLSGAACWRADGTPVGISGGLARAGVRFTLEARRS
jgi:gamma-glutamyltranspeptidase/glutathione hydrolase